MSWLDEIGKKIEGRKGEGEEIGNRCGGKSI
jgi:hypothetical protein